MLKLFSYLNLVLFINIVRKVRDTNDIRKFERSNCMRQDADIITRQLQRCQDLITNGLQPARLL